MEKEISEFPWSTVDNLFKSGSLNFQITLYLFTNFDLSFNCLEVNSFMLVIFVYFYCHTSIYGYFYRKTYVLKKNKKSCNSSNEKQQEKQNDVFWYITFH